MSLTLIAPQSKSMTQRALLMAALADGPVVVDHPLECDDSRLLLGALEALGVHVQREQHRVTLHGGKLSSPARPLDCGNAGTTLRFGAALGLLTEGELILDGSARMRQRPVGPLGDALRGLGLTVGYARAEGFPPITLCRQGEIGSTARVDVSTSSQFASGLLLVAPRLPRGLRLELEGEMVSVPYLKMTTDMMARAGAELQWLDERTIEVLPRPYRLSNAEGGSLTIEPDWSGAAFLLAAGRIAGVDVHVPGLPPEDESLQGDAVFRAMLTELDGGSFGGGSNREHEFDLTGCPDLIAPLATVALFATRPTRLRGVAHARVKESDRIAVLAEGFRRVGANVQEHPDGMTLQPLARSPEPPPESSVELDPADDHRMAMSFGLLSLRLPGITVADPNCVTKSFPGFWETLEEVRAGMTRSKIPAPPIHGPVLVGMRGAGKSTIGPEVARRLGLEILDSDDEIERRDQRSISEIFAADGEPYFRRLEQEVLLDLLARPGNVVATGGGAVLHEPVRNLLAERWTVWLHAPLAVLAERIAGTDRPPLLPDRGDPGVDEVKAELTALYRVRQTLYQEVADLVLDTGALELESLTRRITDGWQAVQEGGGDGREHVR